MQSLELPARWRRRGEQSARAKQRVRAVLRDARKGLPGRIVDARSRWRHERCRSGSPGVQRNRRRFRSISTDFRSGSRFPEAGAIASALRDALLAAQPAKVVCLSTIGAQATRPNLLTQLSIMEQVLGELPMPVTFLRRPGTWKTVAGMSLRRATMVLSTASSTARQTGADGGDG